MRQALSSLCAGVVALALLEACSLLVDTDARETGAGPDVIVPDAVDAYHDGSLLDAPLRDAPDAAASAYASLVMRDAPLAYWRMGVRGGITVPDETGRGNSLVFRGNGHALGVSGALQNDPDTAIGLDGVEAHLAATKPRALDFVGRTPFSLECWVRVTAPTGGPAGAAYYQQIFNNSVGFGNFRKGYLLYAVPTPKAPEKPFWQFERSESDAGFALRDALAIGVFTHHVVTYDGARTIIYANGVEKARYDSTGVLPASTGDFLIGADQGGGAVLFGAVDEAAVYDRALSAIDVIAHFEAGTR
jgi:hypothetical protein